MKLYLLLSILLGVILSFQNCGETARTKGIFADEYTEASLSDCKGADCLQAEELLWMQIREYEPYKVSMKNASQHFNVGGRCGIGTFPNHSFVWTLRKGFGNQEVVGRGASEALCEFGRFQVPIQLNVVRETPPFDQRYQLSMELIGINEFGQQYSNPMPVNNATLDIIFYVEN